MSIGFDSAARELENFFLGAVMQQDPFLEEFGTLPDEPPDVEPTRLRNEAKETPTQKPQRQPTMEQGLLFGDSSPEPPKKEQPPKRPIASEPKPVYRPKATLGYADYKRIFNGDVNLAVYWYNKTSGNVVARKK